MKLRPRASSLGAEKAAVAAIFVVLLGVTWIVWSAFRSGESEIARSRFESESAEVAANIRNRMAVYEQVLLGGSGLFDAFENVTRQEWRRYVETLQLGERFPGIQGVGFALHIPADAKDAHVAAVRAEGFPDYDIRPTDPRPVYTSIVFLEPFVARNLRAFGYDMFAEATRRAAMEAARNTGRPYLSGRVTLVQETESDVQAGVLLYVPVYRHNMPRLSPEEMQSALFGYVYSPFRMNDLMAGILGREIDNFRLEIFDGGFAGPSNLLYDSFRPTERDVQREAQFESLKRLQIYGRPWLVRITSLAPFEREARGHVPTLIATIGGLLSVILAGAAWFFTVSKATAFADIRRIVENRTSELVAARDQAEAANRAKSEFLAMMSHEIRTPIHGVMGAIGLVGTAKDEKERQRWAGLATRSVNSLLAIINDVLDFSKIEAGHIEIHREPDRIRPIVQAAADSLAPLARDKGLDYEVEFAGDVNAWVSVDAGRIRQILSNLIGNAVKFTHRGFVRIRAETVGFGGAGVSLRVTVSDSGIGIPESERSKLFQEFSRLDRKRRGEIEGSGLGLAISQRLVQMMGGNISVDSTEGVGSAFCFEIPLERAEAPTAATATEIPEVAARPLAVLVVDDSQANCDIAKAYLSASGHRVSVAMNGLDGFSAIIERDFDVVIMDMVMPVMDGIEASRRIRALGGTKGATPIIGLTADVTGNRAKFADVGVGLVLTKPIAGPALVAAVQQAADPKSTTSEMPVDRSPSAPGTQTESGIDWRTVEKLRKELGVRLANDLLSGFVEEMANRVDELEQRVRTEDRQAIRKEAHRLAGSSGSYGLAEASSLARRLESSAASGNQDQMVAQAGQLASVLLRDTARLRDDIRRDDG